ncbi:MAG TPA: prepilin-type N-terminal cleavage/methylation domain-containing protein, partial [Myxococcaceae bacterium]|nr:prepilin-type N-terminal cleavage/methylation domain-containing protein [Myxococcaceae bacterium]
MRRASQRGLTLIELMVGVAVAMVVFAGVSATFLAVQAAYHREAKTKTVIESSRGAATFLEGIARYAGYGVPPNISLDFAFSADNEPVDGTTAVTDDFAFRYR